MHFPSNPDLFKRYIYAPVILIQLSNETSGFIGFGVVNTAIGVTPCFPMNQDFIYVSRMGESVYGDGVGSGTISMAVAHHGLRQQDCFGDSAR